MVAGDSKRIVVIKNISSNLIEEAILILRGGSDTSDSSKKDSHARSRSEARTDFLLKEAEYIINEYIKEHGLLKKHNRRTPQGELRRFRISVNAVVNIILVAAVLLLLVILSRTV
jgi:hypothetical protein